MMETDYTFAMIKPCAFNAGHTGAILQQIADAGFSIAAMKTHHLSEHEASEFYREHNGQSFFDPLVKFMISGMIVVMILRRTDAVKEFRKLIGTTDPAMAESGTIRQKFGISMRENAVHGSDCRESAVREASFFFASKELL